MTKEPLNAPGLWRIKRDTEWNEYIVVHPTNPRAHYHTDDKQDAIDTRKAMMDAEAANVAKIEAWSASLDFLPMPQSFTWYGEITPNVPYVVRTKAGRELRGTFIFREVQSTFQTGLIGAYEIVLLHNIEQIRRV